MTVMPNSIAWAVVASLCAEVLSRTSLRFDVFEHVRLPAGFIMAGQRFSPYGEALRMELGYEDMSVFSLN